MLRLASSPSSIAAHSAICYASVTCVLLRQFATTKETLCNSAAAPSAAVADTPDTVAPPSLPVEHNVRSKPDHRIVGGVFLVRCKDHPFKHSWEVAKMLRDLRFEFRGQLTIHPDVPSIRQKLWRARHVVEIDRLDLDEAKQLVGIPSHINFTDLAAQIPSTFGRGRGAPTPFLRSKRNFMQYRRMRLRDIMRRDEAEKALLEEKRKLLASQQQAVPAS